VIIEHPRRDGWRFSSEALDASSADSHRLRVQVDAGATVEVKAQEAQTRNETYALVDAGGDDLLYWSGLAADKEMAASLRKLAGLRGDVADAQAALEKLQSERGTAEKNQSRIRENLRSVPQQSELAQRYLSMLGQEEDRIAGLQGQIDKAQAALDTLHENMAAYIRDMG
jgi:chromosome segregation ATPase